MWPTTERRYIAARSWTCDPPKHPVTLNSEDRTTVWIHDNVDGTKPPRDSRRSCPLVTAASLPHSTPHATSGLKNDQFHWRSGVGTIISGFLIIMIESRHLRAVNARMYGFSCSAMIDIFSIAGESRDCSRICSPTRVKASFVCSMRMQKLVKMDARSGIRYLIWRCREKEILWIRDLSPSSCPFFLSVQLFVQSYL